MKQGEEQGEEPYMGAATTRKSKLRGRERLFSEAAWRLTVIIEWTVAGSILLLYKKTANFSRTSSKSSLD